MCRRWRARREAIGQRLELVEGTSPREIKPSRCTSTELFFCCCGSAAVLPALANCNGRRGAAGNGPGTKTKKLRCTASGTAGSGLGTTIKYLRQTTSGAAGNGLGATVKYLRRTASGAAGSGLGTTVKYLLGATGIFLGTTINYLRRKTSASAGSGMGTARRREHRPGHHHQVPAAQKRAPPREPA
jgi:hypothetical protein